jgi:hypothetical protein
MRRVSGYSGKDVVRIVSDNVVQWEMRERWTCSMSN